MSDSAQHWDAVYAGRPADQNSWHLFGAGFTLEHCEREEHRTPGGAVQPFTWVVLRRAG